jgi:hypothetical protein
MISTNRPIKAGNTGRVFPDASARTTFGPIVAGSGTLTGSGLTLGVSGIESDVYQVASGTVSNASEAVINIMSSAVGSPETWFGDMTGDVITEAARLMPYIVRSSDPISDTASDTAQKVIKFADYKHILRSIPSEAVTLDTNIPGLLRDDPQSRFETRQLIVSYLEDRHTEESMEIFELEICDIIDRYEERGIAALETQLSEPDLEPLSWKFLAALGVRRGWPLDNLAKRILLGNLNSRSAGRRSAAASALGAFPDEVVLAALEHREAIETNRIVLATLKAHIRVLKRDGLPIAKIA